MYTLDDLRADFDARAKRSLSMPLAGLIVWAIVAVLGVFLPPKTGIFALVCATGGIFPIAMAIARFRGEQLIDNRNPLATLMGICVIMVNLLWAIHLPLLVYAPTFVPLSLGIGLGLHWMVYSWIIRHPLGYQHAVMRTAGLVAAWFAFPSHRVTACAIVVVGAYAVTLVQMRSRPALPQLAAIPH